MKHLIWLLPFFLLSACGGRPDTDLKADSPVDMQVRLIDLESLDVDSSAKYEGKIAEVSATVIKPGKTGGKEKEFGHWFLYVQDEPGPQDPYTARMNVYSYASMAAFQKKSRVRIKGRISFNRAMRTAILVDCFVQEE